MNPDHDAGNCRYAPEGRSAVHCDWTAATDALLVAAGRGDCEAFGAFYDRTAPWVYELVLGVLRHRRRAARVTAQVYLQVWRGAAGFDSAAGSGHAMVMSVARRALSDLVGDLPIPTPTPSGPDLDDVRPSLTGSQPITAIVSKGRSMNARQHQHTPAQSISMRDGVAAGAFAELDSSAGEGAA